VTAGFTAPWVRRFFYDGISSMKAISVDWGVYSDGEGGWRNVVRDWGKTQNTLGQPASHLRSEPGTPWLHNLIRAMASIVDVCIHIKSRIPWTRDQTITRPQTTNGPAGKMDKYLYSDRGSIHTFLKERDFNSHLLTSSRKYVVHSVRCAVFHLELAARTSSLRNSSRLSSGLDYTVFGDVTV
jgi:hypothetical protein